MAAGDLWKRLKGSFSSTFQLGKSGPLLKNSSGVVEARNPSDSAYAVVRGLDPVSGQDLVTFTYLATALSGISSSGLPAYNLMPTGTVLTIPSGINWFMSRRLTMQGSAQIVVHGSVVDVHCGPTFTTT